MQGRKREYRKKIYWRELLIKEAEKWEEPEGMGNSKEEFLSYTPGHTN